jgi:hypothetical protein
LAQNFLDYLVSELSEFGLPRGPWTGVRLMNDEKEAAASFNNHVHVTVLMQKVFKMTAGNIICIFRCVIFRIPFSIVLTHGRFMTVVTKSVTVTNQNNFPVFH